MKRIATLAVVLALAPMACANQQRDRQQQQPPSPPPAADAAPPALAPDAQPARPNEPQRPAEPSQPPSNTWYARRQVQVSTSNRDDDEVRAAVQSVTDVEAVRAIADARGVRADNGAVMVRALPRERQGNAVEVEIVVDLSKAPPNAPRVAREVADDVVQRLRKALTLEAQGGLADQAQRFEQERQRADAEMARTRDELAKLKATIREATGRTDASAERIRNELAQLEDHRQEAQLELESRAARMNALSENMAKITAKVEQSVQTDTVSAELAKVVEAREAQVARAKEMLDAGKISRGEYDDAIAQAAEARARLMERRGEVAERAGQGTLADWNREVMRLSVDSAELQARLDKLNQRLQGYGQIADQLDHYEALQQAQQDAERTVRDARAHLRELNRELSRVRAARSVITESEDRTGQPGSAQGSGGE